MEEAVDRVRLARSPGCARHLSRVSGRQVLEPGGESSEALRRRLLGRRQALLGLFSAISCCSRREESPAQAPAVRSIPLLNTGRPAQPSISAPTQPSPPPSSAPGVRPPAHSDEIDVSSIFLPETQGGPYWIRIAAPHWETSERLPLLIALHGLGEARKGGETGSWGWIRDYKLCEAMLALRLGTLRRTHFHSFVHPQRLKQINRSLRERPFRGLVVACPYTPDLLASRSLDNVWAFASLIADGILPRIRSEIGVLSTAIGLDGVSLGGRIALLAGLLLEDRVGAVGSMQTAIQAGEVAELSRRIATTWGKGGPRLRLLTSEEDFYRQEVQALHVALSTVGVKHDYLLIPGPHSYAFNQGPGAIEMLLWHDRVLRGEEPL